MSAPDIDREKMDYLASVEEDKLLSILLGAGASVSSGLPDWDSLVIDLLGRVNVPEESAKLLLAKQDPIIVVETARRSLGVEWEEELQRFLYKEIDREDDLTTSSLHRAASGVYSRNPNNTRLITLNFDKLIEMALQLECPNSNVESLTSFEGTKEIQRDAVYHLHGVIDHREVDGVVFGLNDYTKLLAEQDSWQKRLIKDCLSRGNLIIAGTSFRDPDLRQWLYTAQDSGNEHSAFVLLAREGFDVSKEQFSQLEVVLRQQWEAVGLKAILVQDYSDAAQIVSELPFIHQEDYQSPQERVSSVWDVHLENFATLQQEYADFLMGKAAKLKEHFNCDEINLTFWLSDAQGSVAAWAKHDRTYREPQALRKVPTGHDSDWIAGQVMGCDDILFKDLEINNLSRWKSVVGVPLQIEIGDLPPTTSGVLTVGFPQAIDTYMSGDGEWLDPVVEVADILQAKLKDVVDQSAVKLSIQQKGK